MISQPRRPTRQTGGETRTICSHHRPVTTARRRGFGQRTWNAWGKTRSPVMASGFIALRRTISLAFRGPGSGAGMQHQNATPRPRFSLDIHFGSGIRSSAHQLPRHSVSRISISSSHLPRNPPDARAAIHKFTTTSTILSTSQVATSLSYRRTCPDYLHRYRH